ncbi:MAG TPA: OstA-like protein, partial [Bacteroidia bacterium]
LLFTFFFSQQIAAQKNPTKVELVNANSLESDDRIGKGVKRLIGNVQFKHEGALLYCDSAYLYPNNTIDAYNNVRIQQGDSMNIYGTFLKYNGNTRVAEIQKNIRLVQKSTTLQTDLLLYDMSSSIATYTTGGTIVSKQNTLTSQYGYFNRKTRVYSFKKNVVLTNPQYSIICDTLNYFSATNTAYFNGPTQIKSKEDFIYCESGWYNTDKDIATFSKKAYIKSKQQKMKGDSIYYDKTKNIGKAYGNVEIIDSTQSLIVAGDYAIRLGKEERSIISGHTILKQYYNTDTLFLHADSLKAIDEHPLNKKNEKDTSVTWRVMYAYHHVKFFREDMQGKCDSLIYFSKDSVMKLFKSPVLWSDKSQLTADKIEIHTGAKKNCNCTEIKKMYMTNNAMIISKEDSVKYNQIKGKDMTGYFKDNNIVKIFVEGNGQTIYFAKDKKKFIGVNKADCSNMMIYL